MVMQIVAIVIGCLFTAALLGAIVWRLRNGSPRRRAHRKRVREYRESQREWEKAMWIKRFVNYFRAPRLTHRQDIECEQDS